MDVAKRPLAPAFGDQRWWAPVNGQELRIATLERLFSAYRPDVIIETGTFRGASTGFFASFSLPVFSVETSIRHHTVARATLWRHRNVTLALGESTALLERLAAMEPRFARPFFYLDAHWESALPVKAELDIVWLWDDALVAIDDFKIPHDPGFGYDDYGQAGAIDLEFCSPPPTVLTCFPAHAAAAESGFRRGTAYMGQGATSEAALQEAVEEGLLAPATPSSLGPVSPTERQRD